MSTLGREFARNVPMSQRFTHGQMSNRQNMQRDVRQTRSVQPGNTFTRVVRPFFGRIPSS